MSGDRVVNSCGHRREEDGRQGRPRPAGRLAAIMILLAFWLAGGQPAAARKIAYMDAPGHWTVVEDRAPQKPRRASLFQNLYVHQISIRVEYQDYDEEGFRDVAQGTVRREAVARALTTIANILNYPGGRLDIVMEPSYNDEISELAAAAPAFPAAPNGFYNGFAFDHLHTGSDPSASYADIYCSVNFWYPFHAGSDNPPFNQYDLESILLHEFSHGLGLLSLASSDGTSWLSLGNPGIFTKWDHLLVTGGTSPSNLWDLDGLFIGNPSNLVGSSPGVVFNGAAALLANGRRPQVYTPNNFETGSSLSHWAVGVGGQTVLAPNLGTGQMRRAYTELDKAALEDLGWRIYRPLPPNAVRRSWTRYE